ITCASISSTDGENFWCIPSGSACACRPLPFLYCRGMQPCAWTCKPCSIAATTPLSINAVYATATEHPCHRCDRSKRNGSSACCEKEVFSNRLPVPSKKREPVSSVQRRSPMENGRLHESRRPPAPSHSREGS